MKKSRPRLCLQSLTLLQDNLPAHTSKGTLVFLEEKVLTILPHQPLAPDLAPCYFYLHSRLRKLSRVGDITQDWLLGQQCFSVLRVYLRKTTRKLSINDLSDLNFVFVQKVSSLKGCTRVLR